MIISNVFLCIMNTLFNFKKNLKIIIIKIKITMGIPYYFYNIYKKYNDLSIEKSQLYKLDIDSLTYYANRAIVVIEKSK